MPAIKDVVVKNMRRIALIMVVVILLISTAVQVLNMHRTSRLNALVIFSQVEQILEENSRELERIQEEYADMCLNDARLVAYILEYNPEAKNSVEELKKIAAYAEVDEIHIFDAAGNIVAGSHPEYFGLSFESGEQIAFFKPLLHDYDLELVQDITPNTSEARLVQYSALWSEDRSFIVQIGMYPSTVLRMTEKNELSHIFSLLRTGVGYTLYAIDPETSQIVGSTDPEAAGGTASEIGFRKNQLETEDVSRAWVNGELSYCMSKRIGENDIVWSAPVSGFLRSIVTSELMMMAGLVLSSVILVYAVSNTMDQTVIAPTRRVNRKLRDIQQGDLKTRVDVADSKEFLELSDHINGMVESLLETTEKLELSEKIEAQNRELERQHEQLEVAVQKAESANRAKSEFLFNMSHDIRTPMNAILGFTDLALESGDPETQREYLKNIDVSSRQLLDLINNILELSRIENHKVVIEEDLVDVGETCRKLSTILDSDLKKKRLAYTLSLELEHPYMYLDTTHYSQIFLNIVSNAVKYTPDGGKITASFRELPGEAPDLCCFETVITDTGIGMSGEFLAHAYESFSRERNSTVSGIQGTGLGLAIVKRLADLMRGTILIESRQGEGTTVTIRLPLRLGDAAEAPERAEEPDEAQFEGKRVLLAEDIDVNAMIAEKLLSRKGLIVERARDGVECVDLLQRAEPGHYDLVLMDIQMPNMDGYSATRVIRSLEDPERAAVPIVAMTANAFKEDCDKAIEAGMDGHIAKPLDAAKVFRTIAEVLRER